MSQTEWIAVSLVLIIIFVVFYLFVPFRFFGGNKDTTKTSSETSSSVETRVVSEIITDSGLGIKDTKIGEGEEARSGKTLTVNYAGRLVDGTKFDSSFDRGVPFTFVLGQGSVIKGWEEGFDGMRVGGQRTLTIPPSLGYGSSGVGSIPPNSTLIFEVQLLNVSDKR